MSDFTANNSTTILSVLFSLRCMDLPPGVFELIADMLPMPRVWHWSILRLKRRCKLAPHQAVCDINIIMDEILTDACIFPGPQQSLLVRISQNPQVSVTAIVKRSLHKMPVPLIILLHLVTFADPPRHPEIVGHVARTARGHQTVE